MFLITSDSSHFDHLIIISRRHRVSFNDCVSLTAVSASFYSCCCSKQKRFFSITAENQLVPVQICKVVKICKIHEKYLVMQMTWNNSRLTSEMHFVHKTLVNQQILLENLN